MPFKKPTLEQVAWVFEMINKNAGGSFRKLIYDRLGFGPSAYSELYSAGGQNITNSMHSALETDPPGYIDDQVDSFISQIEVLRPVYEAAKMYKGAYDEASTPYAKLDLIRNSLFREVLVAARELEDSDE
jgi:hypothetical protein